MANNELQEQELQSIIEQSVDDAVKRAFKKYGRVSWRSLLSPRRLLSFLVILVVLAAASGSMSGTGPTNRWPRWRTMT